MTSGKSKRERRIAEAKKRAALYSVTPKSRYGQTPVRSQAWANAQRRRERRNILKVVGVFSVVVVLVVVIAIQHNRDDKTAVATIDTSADGGATPSGSAAATATTAAPVPPPALTAQVIAGATGALAITKPLATYGIKYDSTYNNAGTTSTSTNDYLVQRPFDSALSIKAPDPETNTDFSAVSAIGIKSYLSGGQASAQTDVPAAGLADFRFDASITDLVADGSYVLKERRTLIGRECQMYRTGQSPETYSMAPPTATNYTDVCIDGSGLILEEIVVVNGSFQQHMVATSVNESPTIASAAFKPLADPPLLSASGSTLAPLDATKVPVPGYWVFATPPVGYTLQSRYTYAQNIADPAADTTSASIPATVAAAGTATTVAKTIIVPSYVDVYVNGQNYIVVHQGPTSVIPTDDATAATAVTSPTLGSVKAKPDLNGTTMLITPASPASWFVEVTGTMSKDALGTIANTLTQ